MILLFFLSVVLMELNELEFVLLLELVLLLVLYLVSVSVVMVLVVSIVKVCWVDEGRCFIVVFFWEVWFSVGLWG